MRRPIVIVVNGIRTNPSRADAFTDRMASLLINQFDVPVEKFEYWTWALTRWLSQPRRVQEIAALLSLHSGREIHLVGHSNGCALILDAMALAKVHVKHVYLLAPAAEADFEVNGLNAAIRSGRLQRVFVFTGGRDLALKFAYLTKKYFLRFLGMGYGSMGYTGPVNVWKPSRMTVYSIEDGGHGAWLKGEHFEMVVSLVGQSCTEGKH